MSYGFLLLSYRVLRLFCFVFFLINNRFSKFHRGPTYVIFFVNYYNVMAVASARGHQRVYITPNETRSKQFFRTKCEYFRLYDTQFLDSCSLGRRRSRYYYIFSVIRSVTYMSSSQILYS